MSISNLFYPNNNNLTVSSKIIADIDPQLIKPGKSGQFLMTNDDGKTEWVSNNNLSKYEKLFSSLCVKSSQILTNEESIIVMGEFMSDSVSTYDNLLLIADKFYCINYDFNIKNVSPNSSDISLSIWDSNNIIKRSTLTFDSNSYGIFNGSLSIPVKSDKIIKFTMSTTTYGILCSGNISYVAH